LIISEMQSKLATWSSADKERKKNRQLEKELRRKEKALAEAAALLILQKKAQAIWGDGEDD
jgi:transposase